MGEVERLRARAVAWARIAATAKTRYGRAYALRRLAHIYQQLERLEGDQE